MLIHTGLQGVLLALALSAPAPSQCAGWDPRFHAAGADGPVFTQSVASLGGTSQLFIGGNFQSVASVPARHIASWDGASWTTYGLGPVGPVEAVAVHDDGSGPALYVGGDNFLQRWDGANWLSLPVSGHIKALAAFDDGGGEALFVGGQLFSVGGPGAVSVHRLARYRAGAWDSLNAGYGTSVDVVFAMEVHDDGGGPALYIGGRFTNIGGAAAARVARWDGTAFTALGAGLTGGGAPVVLALQSHTTSTGARELHVGGAFYQAGGAPATNWAVWSGGAWREVGGASVVFGLTVRREPAGAFVHAARSDGVERHDGFVRAAMPFGASVVVTTIAAYGVGATDDVFCTLSTDGRWFRWDGAGWVLANAGLGVAGAVRHAAAHDFGGGEELVVSRYYPPAGDPLITRFDGREWRAVGGPELAPVGSLRLESEGGELYCLGALVFGAHAPVAHFDGATWRPLGPATSLGQIAYSLATFDAGAGPELFVGGRFTNLGHGGARCIARWSGGAWVGVGGSVTSAGSNDSVGAVEVWDDGGGTRLYAAGQFTSIGGVAARNVARWDGLSWAPLGAGVEWLTAGSFGAPFAAEMVVFDSPQGERLVVAGTFDLADGAPAANIAAWDGAQWTPLGSGLTTSAGYVQVFALGVGDPDGHGERLYASGLFDLAGGQPCHGAAVWDGFAWAPLDVTSSGVGAGSGITGFVESVASAGRAVYAVGTFQALEGVPSANIGAYWDACGDVTGTPVCTSTVNSSGRRGLLRASRSTSVTAANLTLVARDLPAGVLTLLANGTAEARGVAGDGVLCLGGVLRRNDPAGVSSSAGELVQAFDFNAPYALGAIAGQSLVMQAFFRDAAGGVMGFNTTDALLLRFDP